MAELQIIWVNILLNVLNQQFTIRAQGDVTILWCPRCRLSMGQSAFYFWGPREWNGLADNIKNTKDIDSFKRTLFNNMFHTKQV